MNLLLTRLYRTRPSRCCLDCHPVTLAAVWSAATDQQPRMMSLRRLSKQSGGLAEVPMCDWSEVSRVKLPRVERGHEDFSQLVKDKLQSCTRTGQACDRCKVGTLYYRVTSVALQSDISFFFLEAQNGWHFSKRGSFSCIVEPKDCSSRASCGIKKAGCSV